MRLDELRPCDLCKGAIAGAGRSGPALMFHRIVIETHLLDVQTIREHLGLAMMLGSERVARAFASRDSGSAIASRRELLICQACRCEGRGADVIEAIAGRDISPEPAKRAE